MAGGRRGWRRTVGAAVIAVASVQVTACGSTPPRDPSPTARIAWVEATDDLEAVGWAARHDPSRHVRRAAVERVRDQDVLWQVATSDPDGTVRRQAIGRLTDPRRLVRIATTAAWWMDRAAAVAVADDRALLQRVAAVDPDPEVRREALERLLPDELRALVDAGVDRQRVEVAAVLGPDDPLLEVLARDEDPRVRAAAVERTADPAFVERALADPDPLVRRTALGRDAASDRARGLARSDPDAGVRAAAVRRVDDQTALLEIVRDDPDRRVRAVAASRLTDQVALLDVVATDHASPIRAAAAARLDDRRRLVELATSDPSPEVRAAAVRRISDQDALRSVAGSEDDPRVRHEIALRVADPTVLASLAGAEAPLATRLVAASRLDGGALADMAREDPSWYVRWTAVGRVEDDAVLAGMTADSHVEVRERARRRRGAPGCEGVLIACPRLRRMGHRGESGSVIDRQPLRDALTEALSGLPISGIEMDWVMEDTPYLASELGVRATVWVERVEARFVVGVTAVSATARGERAGRVADLTELVPDADWRIVDQRPAEVDAVAWLAELLSRLDDLPDPGDPNGLLAPAVEVVHWRRAAEPDP
jgi:hypothetical protein